MPSTPVIRPVGYIGGLQQTVIPAGYDGYVECYLWGGGGGAGGWDGEGAGGNGSGSGYAAKTITVNPGDVLTVAVGGGGGGGASGSSVPGGIAGASYIGSGFSYSGAYGGQLAGVGNGGSAAGGGGATVLLLNGSVVAVAGGGGGGGGASSQSTKAQTNAPGPRGQFSGSNAGENGSGPAVAPGGGGGGGYYGGNGGYPGWVSGEGGSYGTSYGDATANPTNWEAAGADTPYYSYVGLAGKGSTGTTYFGGPGRNGGAVFVFYGLGGSFVHQSGSFQKILQTYVKVDGQWRQARDVYVKQAGIWTPTANSADGAPNFYGVVGNWGIDPRGGTPPYPPMGMGMGDDGMGGMGMGDMGMGMGDMGGMGDDDDE